MHVTVDKLFLGKLGITNFSPCFVLRKKKQKQKQKRKKLILLTWISKLQILKKLVCVDLHVHESNISLFHFRVYIHIKSVGA